MCFRVQTASTSERRPQREPQETRRQLHEGVHTALRPCVSAVSAAARRALVIRPRNPDSWCSELPGFYNFLKGLRIGKCPKTENSLRRVSQPSSFFFLVPEKSLSQQSVTLCFLSSHLKPRLTALWPSRAAPQATPLFCERNPVCLARTRGCEVWANRGSPLPPALPLLLPSASTEVLRARGQCWAPSGV